MLYFDNTFTRGTFVYPEPPVNRATFAIGYVVKDVSCRASINFVLAFAVGIAGN
jgi:hypothetical protein